MIFWNSVLSLFGGDDVASPFGADFFVEVGAINPATGLPMVCGSTAGFDVAEISIALTTKTSTTV